MTMLLVAALSFMSFEPGSLSVAMAQQVDQESISADDNETDDSDDDADAADPDGESNPKLHEERLSDSGQDENASVDSAASARDGPIPEANRYSNRLTANEDAQDSGGHVETEDSGPYTETGIHLQESYDGTVSPDVTDSESKANEPNSNPKNARDIRNDNADSGNGNSHDIGSAQSSISPTGQLPHQESKPNEASNNSDAVTRETTSPLDDHAAQSDIQPEKRHLESAAEPTANGSSQTSCFITFYSDDASQRPSILARKIANSNSGDTVHVDVTDVIADPPTSTKSFEGWLYEGRIVRDSIEVNPHEGDVDLYPAFSEGHWIRFDSCDPNGTATSAASVYVGSHDDAPSSLPVPTCKGFLFDGWFESPSAGDSSVQDDRVTNNAGAVLDPAALSDTLERGNLTLYAHWVGQETTFRVVTWLQNPHDDGYAYDSSYLYGDDDNELAIAGQWTDIADVQPREGFESLPVEQQLIKGDGTTVVNVYYDRNVYEILFHTQRAADSPVYDELTITARYGQDVHDKWPQPSAEELNWSNAWYTTPDTSNMAFVTGIATMPLGGADFYPLIESGIGFKNVYRVQSVDGLNTFNDYVSESFSIPGTVRTSADDYMAIRGFRVNAASAEDAEAIRANPVGDPNATYDPNFETSPALDSRYNDVPLVADDNHVERHTLYFHYLRNQYDIVFVENGGADVADVRGVYYEASLAGNEPSEYVPGETRHVTDSGATLVFEGWYANDALVGDAFNFESEKMPAGNLVLYAKWEPVRHLVQIDPNGGVFEDPSQSTYFHVEHGESIGTIETTRDYVEDPLGTHAYRYETHATDDDGFGVAAYEPIGSGETTGERYRPDDGAYSLFGWYLQGQSSEGPFDFSTPIVSDVTLVAKWRALGSFDLAYRVDAKVDGDAVTGTLEQPTDAGYADLSPTFLQAAPSAIASESGAPYRFVGWMITDGFSNDATALVDEIYAAGAPFTVDSELARGNVIHVQAVYTPLGNDGGESESTPEPGGSGDSIPQPEPAPEGNAPGGGAPEPAPEGDAPGGAPEPAPEGGAPGGDLPDHEPHEDVPDNSSNPDENSSAPPASQGDSTDSPEPDKQNNPTGDTDSASGTTPDAGAPPDEKPQEGENAPSANEAVRHDEGAPTSPHASDDGTAAHTTRDFESNSEKRERKAVALLPATGDSPLAAVFAVTGLAALIAVAAFASRKTQEKRDNTRNSHSEPQN